MAKIHPQIAACFLPSHALNGIQVLVFVMKAKQSSIFGVILYPGHFEKQRAIAVLGKYGKLCFLSLPPPFPFRRERPITSVSLTGPLRR